MIRSALRYEAEVERDRDYRRGIEEYITREPNIVKPVAIKAALDRSREYHHFWAVDFCMDFDGAEHN